MNMAWWNLPLQIAFGLALGHVAERILHLIGL